MKLCSAHKTVRAEIHQYFIFNTPAGIGSKPDLLIRLECGNALDQPDGSDGNQIVLVAIGGVIFF